MKNPRFSQRDKLKFEFRLKKPKKNKNIIDHLKVFGVDDIGLYHFEF